MLTVWILDTAHQGCVVGLVYKYCISHFGDYAYTQQMPYALWYMLLFSVCPRRYHAKTAVLKLRHAGVDSGYRAVFSGLSGLYSLVVASPACDTRML